MRPGTVHVMVGTWVLVFSIVAHHFWRHSLFETMLEICVVARTRAAYALMTFALMLYLAVGGWQSTSACAAHMASRGQVT